MLDIALPGHGAGVGHVAGVAVRGEGDPGRVEVGEGGGDPHGCGGHTQRELQPGQPPGRPRLLLRRQWLLKLTLKEYKYLCLDHM